MSGEIEAFGELVKAANESGLTKAGGELAARIWNRLFGPERQTKRRENTTKLFDAAAWRLESENAERIDPDPKFASRLVIAAADEDNEILQDLWARLLAAACDKDRSKHVRHEFIDLVKQLNPIDARVLQYAWRLLPTPTHLPADAAFQATTCATALGISLTPQPFPWRRWSGSD
jgi:hypothetical protein